LYLFVSHSSKDNPIVQLVMKELKKSKVENYWVDIEKIKDNSAIRAEINSALRKTTHFLVIWSKNTQNADDKTGWVERELNAVDSDKKITKIIFKIDDTDLPPLYRDFKHRSVTLSNVRNETNDIIKSYADFPSQLIQFCKTVCEDYESSSDKPLIKNFKKFHGNDLFVEQGFLNINNKTTGTKISTHVLQLIKQNIENRRIERNLLKEVKDVISKLKELEKKKRHPDDQYHELNVKKYELDKQLEKITSARLIPIVGDYGSGKSALAHHVFYKLCQNFVEEYIPLFIPLGDLPKHDDSADHLIDDIFEFITTEYKFTITKKEFQKLLSDGKIIFVLDALDEMSIKLDAITAQNNLHHIIKLAEHNSVVLTSRHTYMTTKMEEKILIQNKSLLLKILDFTPQEIEHFLKLFLENSDKTDTEINEIRKKVLQDDKVKSLAQKPLFLHVICDNFPKLKDYFLINESVILSLLTDKWIIHDVKKKNLEKMKESKLIEDRQRISEILALSEYKKGVPISLDEIKLEVGDELGYTTADAQNTLAQYYNDAINSTFLTKEEDDRFRFILRSVIEYFVARRIVSEIRDRKKLESFISHVNEIRTNETFEFIKGIIDIEWAIAPHIFQKIPETNSDYNLLKSNENLRNVLFELISKIRVTEPHQNVSNFIKILQVSGNLLPKMDLSRFNLTGASIPGANLSRANLNGANLTDANLSGAILDFADLSNAILKGANLRGATLSGANLTRADLTGVNLSGATLTGAKLLKTVLKNSNVSAADLTDANATGCDLSNAKIYGANLVSVKTKGEYGPIILQNADLSNCTFNNTDLTNLDLSNTTLINVNLNKMNLSQTKFIKSNLSFANLSEANFTSADLRDANLGNSNLTRANLAKTRLINAKLTETDFNMTDLTHTKLDGVDLRQCLNLPISRKNAKDRGAIIGS